ncbi:hypothetical protein PVAP13_5NG300342 [Panicum virgatum]|uniref:Uncharacterized protein n=1 Tax=Panicum virgatum TaxID=38727 RepID=A0A8T0RZC6_PANVG|nr:hypothetical protein PVAP13_5NG300342 [Panicum virgatum]
MNKWAHTQLRFPPFISTSPRVLPLSFPPPRPKSSFELRIETRGRDLELPDRYGERGGEIPARSLAEPVAVDAEGKGLLLCSLCFIISLFGARPLAVRRNSPPTGMERDRKAACCRAACADRICAAGHRSDNETVGWAG